MKKVFSFLVLAASVVMAANSCQKETQSPEESPLESSAENSHIVPDIHFNAISDGQIDPAETKTAAVIDGDETYVKWLSSDRLIIVESATKSGVTTVNSIKTSGAPSLSSKDGHDDVIASFGATVSGSPVDGAEDYIYTAVYPSVVVSETETNLVEKTTPGTYRLNFPASQHLQGNNLSSDSDLLISTPIHKGTTRVVEDEDLEFRYKRIGTLVKLTLKGLTASEKIQSVAITAPKSIAGYINVNPAEGSYETSPYYAQSNSVLLTVDDLTTTGSDVVWFRVLPGAWVSGQTLQVVVETDKATYSRTTAKSTDITLTKNLEFADGGLTKLAINMATRRDSKDTSVKYDITSSISEIDDDATYLITSTVEGTTYAMTSHGSYKYYEKVNMLNEPVAGVLSVTTEEIVTVSFIAVTGEDGKYYLRDSEGYYVGCSAAKTLLFESTFATIKDDNSYKWEISYSEGIPTLSSPGGDMKYNSTSPRFLTYASGQKDISIYVQQGTLKADPELRFLDDSDNDVSSIILAWDDRGTFSAPTLANPHTVSVAYTSSNPAAVSVDSEGNIAINGGGRATITATSISNSTYRKSRVSYVIIVTGAPVAVETIVVSETWSASLKNESGNNAKFVDDGLSIWEVDGTYGRVAANNATASSFYSPKFDMSSVEAGSISFSHTGNVTGDSYQNLGKVYYTLNNGDTWTQIILSNPATNWSWQTATISSEIYAGETIQFRWDFQGNSSKTWEVNDFVITVPAHSITIDSKTSLTVDLDSDHTIATVLDVVSAYSPWSVKTVTGDSAADGFTYSVNTSTNKLTITPKADNTTGSKRENIGTIVLTDSSNGDLCTITLNQATKVALKTATLTLASGNSFSTTSPASKTDDKGFTWTMTSTKIGAWNNDYKGQQIGVSSTPATATVTADFSGKTVTKVVVKAGTGNAASLSVRVGSTDFKCGLSTSVSVSSGTANGGKEYEFTGSATGTIIITLAGSSKACYYGGHIITYSE